MADQSFKQLRTKLDTRLNDSGNTIFDTGVKDEFVLEALNDPYVYIIDRDKTTTTVQGQVEYPVPDQLRDALQVGLDINSDGNTSWLDPSAFEVINGTIIFDPFYSGSIPVGVTMIILGPRQLANTDTIPQPYVEYVMQLSLSAAWEWLANKLGDNFLTNDMTMGDLLNKVSYHSRRASELRRTLPNRYVARF